MPGFDKAMRPLPCRYSACLHMLLVVCAVASAAEPLPAPAVAGSSPTSASAAEIGRAAGRGRGEILVGGGSLKKKNQSLYRCSSADVRVRMLAVGDRELTPRQGDRAARPDDMFRCSYADLRPPWVRTTRMRQLVV